MSKLVWSKTGDTIDLAVVDPSVYEYFVENLNTRGINHYHMADLGFASLRQELIEKHNLFRKFVQTSLKSNLFDFDIDPSNQYDLNKLHRTWVKFHQRFPNIGRVFDKAIVDRINKMIHDIETICQTININTPRPDVFFPNPFGTKILKHGVWNITVEYNNLGRASFNKWFNGDEVNDIDTNNFKEFYTELIVKVVRSEEYPLSLEYQNWCKQYDLECVGGCLPLANFDNLEKNLLKYRQLVLTNSVVQDNFIILE